MESITQKAKIMSEDRPPEISAEDKMLVFQLRTLHAECPQCHGDGCTCLPKLAADRIEYLAQCVADGLARGRAEKAEDQLMTHVAWKCRTCGCVWHDTFTGFVGLMNADQKSCAECEHRPTQDVCDPLSTRELYSLAVSREREACAKLVENFTDKEILSGYCRDIAAAIRDRNRPDPIGELSLERPEPIAPIALNADQEWNVKTWAANDRLWTTQETVEFNLRTFARAILAIRDRRTP